LVSSAGYAIAFATMVYAVISCIVVPRRRVLRPPGPRGLSPASPSHILPSDIVPSAVRPSVTVLKPLCGAEPETYEYLRSFCLQAYPTYQVIFGVSDPMDPAVDIVHRLQREFPDRDLQLVVDRRQHGSNRKVSNLINLMPKARHDVLVISDADVRVPENYLADIVASLGPDVGIVTCGYRGSPRADHWSLLGSLFINEWFMPSVYVAATFGSRSFAFGATIAIRRQVLSALGGFNAIADQLADDYRLGEMTRSLGLRTVFSDLVVDTSVVERSFADLVHHELRWLRTIRALRPVSYCFCFVTFSVPSALLGALLAGGKFPAVVMLFVTSVARLLLHARVGKTRAALADLAALPLRDLLSLGLWGWSFVTRRVQWRDDQYSVSRDGSVQRVVEEMM
jgi:ceramide glucosyltransferase